MRFAIATHALFATLDVDDSWDVGTLRILGRGYHYGIGLGQPGGETTTGRGESCLVYRGGESVDEQNDMSLRSYLDGQASGSSPLVGHVGDVHQIACANGGLYLANTRFNSVAYQHLDGRREEFFFSNVAHDSNHVNSVFACGDRLYVLLHNNHYRESQVVVLSHRPGLGFRPETVLSLWHTQCHNLFVDPGRRRLVYNASLDRKLVVVDLESESIVHTQSFDKHTKGLSVTRDHYLVGLSDYSHRSRRGSTRAYLGIVDRSSWQLVKIVDLQTANGGRPLGNLNEIRCLSGEELAHHAPAGRPLDLSQKLLAQRSPREYYTRLATIRLGRALRTVKGRLETRIRRLPGW
jgi:hypothetical protein